MGMLTNGEHDNLWRNAFKSIPNIDNDLRLLVNQTAYQTQLDVLKELHNGEIIDDKSYYNAIVMLGSATKLLNDEEAEKCKDEVNNLYS